MPALLILSLFIIISTLSSGIEGGFPSPQPRTLYLITRATGSGILVITTQIRPKDDFLQPVIS